MKVTRPKVPPKKPLGRTKHFVKDPIEVFCRLRPLENANEMCCARVFNSTTVTLTPPDNMLFRNGTAKELHYTFTRAFDETTDQKAIFDRVALQLIKNLFEGANGLLFTYGISSSGKTYTMAGTPEDCGLLPRCLDVIFNSIQNYQTMKYVFKPDKFNGFEIQSAAEAMLDVQKELGIFSKTPKSKREFLEDWNERLKDATIVDDLATDSGFSVFVSYVEIYNNYIYDLLEELPIDSIKPKLPQSKILREDSFHNMYVFSGTEVEVKSADEALECFCKGQQRRRVSHTALNAQSSRSHSIFTIRIVQAPLDSQGAEVLQDKDRITISQLSLVDLAGSERSDRTKNKGDRLREAGNINASLMALRTCIEILREVQTQGGSKMVPYRESKLTHLFKAFFEGEGKIRMIVCVNPRVDDYEETVHVMKFSEMTQEVLISRPTPVATTATVGLRNGRGNMYREALRKAKEEGIPVSEILPPVVYNLGPEFSPLFLNFAEDESILNNLVTFLVERKDRRVSLKSDFCSKLSAFRNSLMIIEKENMLLKQDSMRFNMDLECREQQIKALERKLSGAEQANDTLRKKIFSYESKISSLELQINENEVLLNQGEREKETMKTRMQNKLAMEKERMKRIMERRIAAKQAELEQKLCFTDEKFRQLREILNSGEWEFGIDLGNPMNVEEINRVVSTPIVLPDKRLTRAKTTFANPKAAKAPIASVVSKSDTNIHESSKPPKKGIAVANPRHRRSASSSGEVWLEHKPVGSLDLGTVLQPKMKKKKSVSKLEVKDVTKEVSKYVLTHQEQDSAGEVETQLYKGDVVPSAGGGAQVIFNDVEKLRQASPNSSYNFRKRNAEHSNLDGIQDRCTMSVECHGKPSKVLRKAK